LTSTFVLTVVKFIELGVEDAVTIRSPNKVSPLNKTFVRKRTPKYGFLKSYLDSRGFRVYPSEIIIGMQDLPYTKGCWAVDVAAFKDDHYYAFEYKSIGDSIASKRLINQIRNYSLSFDYVIVVAQVTRKTGQKDVRRLEASINPKRGCHMREILSLGAGFWTVQFGEIEDTSVRYQYKPFDTPVWEERLEPKLQHPHPENKLLIEQKFKRYVFGNPVPEDPHQKTIEQFLH